MLIIGLISGTSVDGIDAALVELTGSGYDIQVNLIAGATYPYPDPLRSQILAVCGGAALSMVELAELDDAIARCFAAAATQIGQIGEGRSDIKVSDVKLIGSHGQTVFHRPPGHVAHETGQKSLGYSLQLGRGDLIATLTGITTISNFRAADIAAGGHGAPLVPAIDVCLLRHPTAHRCIQNLGGIGNVAYLPPATAARSPWDTPIRGWDTGPANSLLDLAVQHLSQGTQRYDDNGAWAAQGTPCLALVTTWLQQDYFQQAPPKSTGRELFGPAYLEQCLQDIAAYALSPADILATLTELTAASIAHSYRSFLPQLPDQVLLAGGGSRNQYLKQRIQANLPSSQVLTTDEAGLNADYKEAIAFAVLAYWRYHNIPGNLPEVTGATQPMLLGEIHLVTL